MGHLTGSDEAYLHLQKHLDRKVQGAPASPTLTKILIILFSPVDAELAARLPHNFTSLDALSRKLRMPKDELDGRLTEMAKKGWWSISRARAGGSSRSCPWSSVSSR